MKETDIAVIGAGPVGLFTGFYAGLRGLSAIIIDKLEMPGGQLAALYPEKYIYDVAGQPKIKAQDLVNNLVEQVKTFEETTTYSLHNEIQHVNKKEDGSFEIIGSKETIHAKTVIIAAGNGAFAPRKLGLEGEDTFENIHYFVNDTSIFTDKKVAIFGGGDSALDWALTLQENAKEVTLIHRRDKFRGHDHSVNLVEESDITKYTPYVPTKLVGENGKLSQIEIAKVKEEDTKVSLDVDDVIVTYGFTSNLGPIEEWGLKIENRKIEVNSRQETNVKGIFAVGDICTYPGKASLIISGMGEGPTAVNGCYLTINPDAKIGALHSSSVLGDK